MGNETCPSDAFKAHFLKNCFSYSAGNKRLCIGNPCAPQYYKHELPFWHLFMPEGSALVEGPQTESAHLLHADLQPVFWYTQ